MKMKATVTARDELESVTAEETVRGYDEENRDTGAWLAALADATDCVYFEGRLQDTDGGVIRVEFVDLNGDTAFDPLCGCFCRILKPQLGRMTL